MPRLPKNVAPDGFIRALQAAMETQRLSLNQAAERAKLSPAFLSRILNRQRGLPSEKTILRLAQVLDIQPPERLLIKAGRIPDDLKPALGEPGMPELLRKTGSLSETDRQQVVTAFQALVLKYHRKGRS